MPKPLNLLILEDNPTDAELLLIELRRAGYKTNYRVVENKKDYTARLKPELDLILSDYNLPQFNGLEALQLRNESGYDIPFIIVSGEISEELAVECMREGADDYLMKDRLGRLGSAVDSAIKRKELRDEKKKSLQKLRESEEYQKTIFETTTHPTIIIEEDTTISMVNKEFERISGYAKEEVEGKMSWTKFVGADDLKKMKEYHQQRRNDPDTTLKQYEFQFISMEGIVRNILLNVDLIPGTKKSVASFLDITHRKQAEREINILLDLSRQASTETKLDDLLFFIANQIVEVISPAETSSIFLYNKERKVLEIQAWTGFPDSEVEGLEFPVDGTQIGRIFRSKKPTLINNVSESLDFEPLDGPIIRKIRSQIAIPLIYRKNTIGIIYTDNLTRTDAFSQKDLDLLESIGNQLAGTIENSQLFDQLAENHKQLSRSEKRLLNAQQVGQLGFVELNLKTNQVFLSDEACRIHGFELQKDLVPHEFIMQAIHPDDYDFVQKSIESLTQSGEKTNIDHRIVYPNGEVRWINKQVEITLDAKGNPGKMLGTVLDITERVHAEQELRESEEKFQVLFKSAPDAYYLNDTKGTFLDGNLAAEKITGYKRDELIGTSFLKKGILSAAQIPRAAKLLLRNKAGHPTGPDKFILTRKDGSKVPVEIGTQPVKILGEHVILGIARDITERVQAEQELELLLDLSRQAGTETNLDDLLFFIANQIVKVIPPAEAASIFLYDEKRKVVRVQAWAGFNDSEIEGLEFSIDGHQVGRLFQTKKPAIIKDVSKDSEFELIDKPSLKSTKSQITVPLIFKKQVIGIIFADNLTRTDAFSQKNLDLLESIGNQLAGVIENARLLDQVIESEQQYHSVVEDSPGHICCFKPGFIITFVNETYCQYFGKKSEELVGMSFLDLILKEDRESVMSSIISLSQESPILTNEHRVIKDDGEIRWMRWTNRALFDEKGKLTSYQSFGEDISERMQAQETVRQEQEKAQRYLDIAGVALVALNQKGEITLINQKGCQILGYQESELIGMNWFNTCLPEWGRKEVKGVFKKIMTGKLELVEFYENPILTRSGEERIIAWHNTVLLDEKGNNIGTLTSGEDITERKRAEQLLNALNRASIAMGAARTQQEIFNAVARELKQIDISCMLFPLDESGSKLLTKYISPESAALRTAEKLVGIAHEDFSFPIDEVDLYRKVVREKKTLFTDNSDQTLQLMVPKLPKKVLAQIIKLLGAQKNISAPLIVEGQAIGVFSIQSGTLTREDVLTATAFADQLSSAWNKVWLLQNLRKTVEGTIHAIAATVEARDPYTAGHQGRVADLAVAISKEMGLSKDQTESIRMAGLIHDLGKINIPAEILSKPGKISELEYKIIQTHPQVGFDLLKEIEFPWPIAEMVHQHHEKMDGSGYPQGLKGDDILLEARILAVADIVEAMSSHRPYRPALGIEKALAQIREERGTLLDPEVVDACLKIFKGGYELLEN